MNKEDLAKIGIGIGLNQTVVTPSWDKYFLNICETVSSRSPDANTKFGALFVKNRRIVSCGYNGFPSGSPDCDMPNTRDINKWKYRYVVHAEENAIYYAARNGIPLNGCTLYCQGHPCSECCKKLISVGVINWVIGNREYQADETEVLLRRFWVETFHVSIRKYND